MLAYLVKCATIQMILLFAQWFQMLPWTLTINVAVIVVVPMLIAAGAWFNGQRAATGSVINEIDRRAHAIRQEKTTRH